MATAYKICAVFLLLMAVGLLGILYWYGSTEDPVTTQEIDHFMTKIEAQPQIFRTQQDMRAFRAFLEADDGKPFYTVNFYKYFTAAQYAAPNTVQDMDKASAAITGRAAFDRFSAEMVKLLATQASHPIFGTNWLDSDGSGWDRLVIVRYRSRRDIAAIFASPEFAAASIHKWAGLEKNQRFLAQGLHIPALGLPMFLIALVLAFLAIFLKQGLKKRR